MAFLHILSGFSYPALRIVAFVFSLFGSSFLFICCCGIIFWTFSKKAAYKILLTYAISGLLVSLLNAIFHIAYPFVSDAGITTMNLIKDNLTGYSFPSIGIFTVASLCAGIFLNNLYKRIKVICVAFYVVVAFSYMYLGLCTPWSVLLATAISIGAAFAARVVVNEFNFDIAYYRFLITITLIPLLIFIFVILALYFNDVISLEGMASHLGFIGTYIGILASIFVEVGCIKMNFHCDHSYQQVIKCAIGAGATLLLSFVLKLLLSLIPGFLFTDLIVNLLITLGAFILYPMIIQQNFAAKYN